MASFVIIGLMERIQQINEAKRRLRKQNTRIGKKGNRMHPGRMQDNADRSRALDGVCGSCENLILKFDYIAGSDSVSLMCRANSDPLDLYRQTDIFDTPECPDRVEVNKVETI